VSDKARLFLMLWLVGLVGVLSILFIDLSALIAVVPMPEGSVHRPTEPVVVFSGR
jgi:hypothetical protein